MSYSLEFIALWMLRTLKKRKISTQKQLKIWKRNSNRKLNQTNKTNQGSCQSKIPGKRMEIFKTELIDKINQIR